MSYSDLATALMIVFMVVMLLMLVRSKLQAAMQQDRVRDVVESIEIILNTKSRLAESINRALEKEPVRADAVTAQVEIADRALSFEIDDDRLKPEGRAFLRRVVPPYVCALWQQDHALCALDPEADCRRLDPDRPRGVRRILVRGHGSLVGGYEHNQDLSSRRAQVVVEELQKILHHATAAGPESSWAALPAVCRDNPEALQRYARERVWAVATGDTEHCTAATQAQAAGLGCDTLPPEAMNDPAFQKVTFGLEVTGDDMTRLLLDIVALRREVGGGESASGEVERIASEVAAACWQDPRRYHGCARYIDECLRDDGRSTIGARCAAMFEAVVADPLGRTGRLAGELCAAPEVLAARPGCGRLP